MGLPTEHVTLNVCKTDSGPHPPGHPGGKGWAGVHTARFLRKLDSLPRTSTLDCRSFPGLSAAVLTQAGQCSQVRSGSQRVHLRTRGDW